MSRRVSPSGSENRFKLNQRMIRLSLVHHARSSKDKRFGHTSLLQAASWLCRPLMSVTWDPEPGQQLLKETIHELGSCFRLVMLENLPCISHSEAMVNRLHVGLPNTLRNSSCVRQADGSRSISSERRRASARPSSSSMRIPGRESSKSAASLARSDSDIFEASVSIFAAVDISRECLNF